MVDDIKNIIPMDADKVITDYQPLLRLNEVKITPYFTLNIPTVEEVLNNDMYYFNITVALTSNPIAYAVELLDQRHIDFSKISEYDLFVIHFYEYVEMCKQSKLDVEHKNELLKISNALDLIIKDGHIESFLLLKIPELGGIVFYNPVTRALINEFIYRRMAEVIRQVNLYKHDKGKVGNESFKEYELEKQRRRIKRNRRKKYNHFFEKQIIALVNNAEFKYNYEETLGLSIYKFNQSLKQVPHLMSYYNTMHGVYAGTVDISKMKDRSSLSWFNIEEEK